MRKEFQRRSRFSSMDEYVSMTSDVHMSIANAAELKVTHLCLLTFKFQIHTFEHTFTIHFGQRRALSIGAVCSAAARRAICIQIYFRLSHPLRRCSVLQKRVSEETTPLFATIRNIAGSLSFRFLPSGRHKSRRVEETRAC